MAHTLTIVELIWPKLQNISKTLMGVVDNLFRSIIYYVHVHAQTHKIIHTDNILHIYMYINTKCICSQTETEHNL